MSTTLRSVASPEPAIPQMGAGRSLRLPALVLGVGGVVLGGLAAADHGGVAYWVSAVVILAWALGTGVVARRLPERPLALVMGLFALVLGAALYTSCLLYTSLPRAKLPWALTC